MHHLQVSESLKADTVSQRASVWCAAIQVHIQAHGMITNKLALSALFYRQGACTGARDRSGSGSEALVRF